MIEGSTTLGPGCWEESQVWKYSLVDCNEIPRPWQQRRGHNSSPATGSESWSSSPQFTSAAILNLSPFLSYAKRRQTLRHLVWYITMYENKTWIFVLRVLKIRNRCRICVVYIYINLSYLQEMNIDLEIVLSGRSKIDFEVNLLVHHIL